MDQYFILVLIILVLSIVQSFFGVGLLVFGTPILLILGYSFEQSLTFLLPSSIVISISQLLNSQVQSLILQRKIIFYSVPGIIIGLTFILSGFISLKIGLVVGIVLILTVLIRNLKYFFNFFKKMLKSNLNTYLFLMGVVHGISNMGGGFLTILSTSIFEKKDDQRYNIAFGYLIFGVTQIIILIVINFKIFTYWSIIFPILSLFIFYSFGNIIFKNISEKTYNILMSVLIFLYGTVLIILNLI